MKSNITTIPHLLLDSYPNVANTIDIPDDIKGDISKEHDFLWPILMSKFPKEWGVICDEVDEAIEDGRFIFDSGSGVITIRR